MSAVSLAGVYKRYRDFTAVRDLTLDISAHRLLALIGHNGAGKTTLLKMVLGITRPSAGTIRLWDHAVVPGGNLRPDQIGFLPEVVHFNDAMSGLEALRFLARLKRQPPNQCASLLSQVGLDGAASKRIKTYSKGMRQRLGLAQALLGNPRLLVLDEPTTGLDPDLRRDFYRIVSDRREQGATIVISTHSLHEIETHADEVAILRHGGLVASGPVPALCEQLGIPVRIRVDLPSLEACRSLRSKLSQVAIRAIDERRLEISCPESEKLAVMQTILCEDLSPTDVHIDIPRLDDVYRHYMEQVDS